MADWFHLAFVAMDSEWAYHMGAMQPPCASAIAAGAGANRGKKAPCAKGKTVIKRTRKMMRRPAGTTTPPAPTPPIMPRSSSTPLRRKLGPWPDTPTMGSVCAGMLTSAYAAMSLACNLRHLWWCENNKDAVKFLKHNFPNVTGITDDRDLATAEAVDVVDAGFPCQPFSLDGKHLGASDPRSDVIHSILLFVMRTLPRIVILENVDGMLKVHPDTLEEILRALSSMKDPAYNNCQAYSVAWQILDSYYHGSVPQSRRRIYIVAIRTLGKKPSEVPVEFPAPAPRASIWRTLTFPPSLVVIARGGRG